MLKINEKNSEQRSGMLLLLAFLLNLEYAFLQQINATLRGLKTFRKIFGLIAMFAVSSALNN